MKTIGVGDTKIRYQIIRTKRKSLAIIIDPDQGVIVRSPLSINDQEIRKLVEEKADWIGTKLKKAAQIKPSLEPRKFQSGEKLLYLGQNYKMKVITDKNVKDVKVTLNIDHQFFLIRINPGINKEDKKEFIGAKITEWYRLEADRYIKERVKKYQVKVGITPNRVRVKEQKKRWGSCSSKGNLNLNWKLIMAPVKVLDYIVVHELGHLVCPNHSRDFWGMVGSIIPEYKEMKEWLRINRRQLTI